MEIDDALAEAQAVEDQRVRMGAAGGKAVYEYDKVLRGYMEAKYANPELKYWDYMKNPSIAGVYRTAGRKKIGEHITAGGDIKDIPGMSFFERQRAGLKGFFEKDAPPAAPTAATTQTAAQTAAQPKRFLAERGSLAAAQAEIEAIEAGGPLPTATQEAAGRELELVKSGGRPGGPLPKDILEQFKGLTTKAKTVTELSSAVPSIAGGGLADLPELVRSELLSETRGFGESGSYGHGPFQEKTETALEAIRGVETEALDPTLKAAIAPVKEKKTIAPEKVASQEGGFEVAVRGGKFYRGSESDITKGGGELIGGLGRKGGAPIYSRPVKSGGDLVGSAQIFEFTDPKGVTSYYQSTAKGTSVQYSHSGAGSDATLSHDARLRFIEAGSESAFDPEGMKKFGMTKLDIDPSVIEEAGGATKYFGSEAFQKAHPVPGVVSETAKAGLKETLGKGVKGLGYGASVVSGAQRLAEGRTTEEKIGGGLQVAGGTAGLISMTNLWNPVGWAAAIPAALSLGGGLMGGGGGRLAGTPLGKYRRRVGIG
jgi:hypothetical protein